VRFYRLINASFFYYTALAADCNMACSWNSYKNFDVILQFLKANQFKISDLSQYKATKLLYM